MAPCGQHAKLLRLAWETLADAEQLREVVSGARALKLPVIPYAEADKSLGPAAQSPAAIAE